MKSRTFLILLLILTAVTQLDFSTSVEAQSEVQLPEFRLHWSPDGSQVAVVFQAEVRLYDAQFTQYTLIPLGSPVDQTLVRNVSWNPSGTLLGINLLIGFNEYVQIWETQPVQLLSQLQDNEIRRATQWSPDGQHFAVVYGHSSVYIYDINTATLISEFTPVPFATIQRFAWNPIRNEIVVGIGTSLYFWDIVSNTQRAQLDNGFDPSNAIAFSPDGNTLATVAASDSANLSVWDVDTLQSSQTLIGHTDSIYEFAWANNDRLATVSFDDTIRVWDVTTGQSIQTITTVPLVHQLEWYPDGENLFVSDFNTREFTVNILTGETIDFALPPPISCDTTIAASDTISLISAITTGNNAGVPYTICLTNSTYSLSAVDNSDGFGANGLPIITGDITIVGNGAIIERDTVSAPDFRFFHVAATANLALDNLTLRNGVASSDGGAIYNAGTLTIDNATLSNNRALADDGGAIDNHGTVNITNSTFENNHADGDDGGAIWNDSGTSLTITDSTFRLNTAVSDGGAIMNFGTISISNSVFDGNTAMTAGGAISADTGSFINNIASNDDGGAIITFAPLTLNNVLLDNNTSGDKGGAVYTWGSTLTIENLSVFSNNDSGHDGGAIFSGSNSSTTTITDTTFTLNTSPQNGAAIYFSSGTNLISSSTFQSNTAAVSGGAIYTFGNLTVNLNTLFDDNHALDDGGAIRGNDTVNITDSTFSNNSAGDQGGAFRGFVSATSSLVNSCIFGNIAGNTSGVYSADDNFNASYNWWGAIDGPSGDGNGSGDAVNWGVDFANFITTTCADAFGANGITSQTQSLNTSTALQSETLVDSSTFAVESSPYADNFDNSESWLHTVRWAWGDTLAVTGSAWWIDSSVRGQASTLEMPLWIDLRNQNQVRLVYSEQAHLVSTDLVTIEIQTQASTEWTVIAQSLGGVYSWQARSIDLAAYRGQTIRLRWRIEVPADEPIGENSRFYAIDDLEITHQR